jgi:hypothetical protein
LLADGTDVICNGYVYSTYPYFMARAGAAKPRRGLLRSRRRRSRRRVRQAIGPDDKLFISYPQVHHEQDRASARQERATRGEGPDIIARRGERVPHHLDRGGNERPLSVERR